MLTLVLGVGLYLMFRSAGSSDRRVYSGIPGSCSNEPGPDCEGDIPHSQR